MYPATAMSWLDRLRKLCSRDTGRPHLGQPGLVEIDGALWTAATDGHYMLAIAGELHAGPFPVELQPSLRQLVAERAPAHEDRVERLRAVAGFAIPCMTCGDNGIELKYCTCPDCGTEHGVEVDCSVCAERISVEIDGALFDAARIARLLRDVPDGPCRWAVEPKPSPLLWIADKFHPAAVALADRHYSRQTVGAPQFLPPGETFVLVTPLGDAVWGVCHNFAPQGAGRRWRVAIFRNESTVRSSDLIREATARTFDWWRRRYGAVPTVPLRTEVDPAKTRRKRDPGRCFRKAGWRRVGVERGLVVLEAPPEVAS